MFPRLTPLWGSHVTLGHQQYHGKPRRSAGGAALLSPQAAQPLKGPSTAGGPNAPLITNTDGALSVKRRVAQPNTTLDTSVS